MRIGIVTTWYERGGAYVSRAYMATLRACHEVFIYARGGWQYARGDPKWEGDFVTWGKVVVPRMAYVDIKDLRRWVERNKLEVVIFNEERSWEPVLEARRLGTLVGAYVDYYTTDTVPFFRVYDFLLCNTKRHYSVFKEHPQAFFVPWGTDLNTFTPNSQPVTTGEAHFFHSAGWSPYRKGTDLLLRAFQRVQGKARLIIHSQAPLREVPSLMSLIEGDSRIEFVEGTVGLPGLYHRGDVYVYPSRLEGIGLTICEAAAAGLPIITTDSPPMNEFVRHRVNGWLVEVQSHEPREDGYFWPLSHCSETSLSEAMQFYVDHAGELSDFKQAARKYAEADFDWSTNSRDLPQLLPQLHRIEVPSDLLSAIRRYERLHLSKKSLMRSILRRIGAGRIKRALLSRLTRGD